MRQTPWSKISAMIIAAFLFHSEGEASPFAKAPVDETELAGMRGGFLLPNGLDVAIAVQSHTSLNGQTLLRTSFVADTGPAILTVQGGPQTDGTIKVGAQGAGTQVAFSNEAIDVRHFAGQLYGTAIANRASDVSIDTATIVTIEIRNATAFNMGSAMFRIEALALDSAGRLVR